MTDVWQAINTALLIVLAVVNGLLARHHSRKQKEIRDVAREGVKELADTMRELERERLQSELAEARSQARRRPS